MNVSTMQMAVGSSDLGSAVEAKRDARDASSEQTIDRYLSCMTRYWEARKQEMLWMAVPVFEDFIDPAFLYGEEPYISPAAYNLMFAEWTLYEFPYYSGRTPLEEYVAQPPHDASAACLACLDQIARSQFFSRFEIRSKDQETNMATLVDVCTSKRYDVHDPHLCHTKRWHDGTIAIRIAQVDDTWEAIGQLHLYDRAEPQYTSIDGPGFFHPEDAYLRPYAEQAGFYLRLLRDIIGIDGRYRHTTTLVS